ncbi:MAG: hypothetical protein M0000_01625 [Actinomycetota bacterium]|nr:hypothetical protein [Actinomycetota bacterium]
MDEQDDFSMDEADWEYLLEALTPLDFLLLEQIYVVERAPVALRTAQRRLSYLNLTERTISRHAVALADRHLVGLVNSCETLLNPVPRLQENVEVLVRIWRVRQQFSRDSHMAAVGQRTLDESS